MANHETPIEEAGLWDVLDWDHTLALSLEAIGDPRDRSLGGRNVLAWAARKLVDCPNEQASIALFHDIQKRFITAHKDAERRQQAAMLADYFGADPQRLIAYIGWKWGVFKQKGRRAD
jgi:hypothetical protein